MKWSCNNSFGSVDGFSSGSVFRGIKEHSWSLGRKTVLVFIVLVTLIVAGNWSGEVFAEETTVTMNSVKKGNCYYVTYTAAGEEYQTNSICFGEDGTMTSEGAAAVTYFGKKGDKAFSVALVGKNPEAQGGLDVFPGSEKKVECVSSKQVPCPSQVADFSTDASGGGIAIVVNYNDEGWQQVGYSGYQKFSADENVEDTKKRTAGFEELAKMANDEYFGTKGIELREDNVDVNGGEVVQHDSGERSGEEVADDYGNKEDNTCQEAKGAENIGWLVCPIMTWMGNAAADVYDNFVQPSLEVGPELFSGGGGTRQAWDIFRNFGNIIFIILLLAVIFSQVTGIGIDNYGIKKILPKLIIAAVLINISYVICVFLVDVSNILGNGFQALFSNISGSDTIVVSAPEGSSFVKDGVEQGNWEIGSILAGVGLLAGVVTLIGAIWADPSILISIFVAGLGVAVAILFLFLLLAARKAAIIVLTVLSPVAVACYVMPNAKSLYDKWWNIFKAMLLVYPIAGLLMGGGDFVSRLLLRNSSSDFFSWFTAMVIGVVPIFFIPMVLKSAFTALGKVGGMLSGIGSSARKKATGAMQNSDTYRRIKTAGAERKSFKSLQKRSGLDKNGQERKSIRNKLARSRIGQAMGLDTAMGRTRNDYMKAKQERMTSVAGMNMDVQNAKILEAQHNIEEQRNIAANKVELGAKPTIRPEKLRVQMQNEMNQALAENSDHAIPLPVSYETALANKQAQQSMQLTKMYADNYAKETDLLKVDRAFKDSINSGNSESAVAAMKELLGRGGTEQVFKALENANWAGMNEDFKNQLAQAMGSSGVDALKSYSKYLSTRGSAGFQDWSTGNISEKQIREEAAAGVKDGTYIQHLMEGGANAMANFDKDQMKFIAGRADAIRSGVGDDAFGAMIKNVAVKSGDAKTKTEAEKVITSQLSGGGLNVSNLGITGEDLGYMRGETALAIRAGVGDSSKLAGGLKESIESARKDAVTMAKMDATVANVFGVK